MNKNMLFKIAGKTLGITTLTAGMTLVSLGCNRKGISFQGNLVNNLVKSLNHGFIRFTGETMGYATNKEQSEWFDFSEYQLPEGYGGEKINLGSCEIYRMYKLDQGSHKKAVYHIHGGGYIGPFKESDFETAIKFSRLYDDADIVLLQYRTAPENLYPCALEDAVSGYQWMLENGYRGSNILVDGDSAGGGLALAMTLYLRDHEVELPRMLCLASPWTDLSASGESYSQNILSDAIFGSLKREDAPRYPVPILYAGEANLTDPYLSPLYGSYEGMPAMLIQTGGTELLLSDSTKVVEKAKEAGVDAQCFIYPGMIHTFYVLLPSSKEGKEAWKNIEKFIERQKKAQ